MRYVLAALSVALCAASSALAQSPPTIADALACEGDSDQAACLLRVGACGWTGDTDHANAAMSAIVRFYLEDEDLGLGPDESGSFAVARAMAEAARRDAAGMRASRALAPIAALPSLERRDAYRLFAFAPNSFLFPTDIWRFRASSDDAVRLALRRIEADSDEPSDGTVQSLALAYAARGMEDEALAVLRRHNAENDATAFWYVTGDLDAAERSMRADGDVHPMTLIHIAGAAIEAGDSERAVRLGRELLDEFVRGRTARIIVTHDPVSFAESGARILQAAGQAEQAREYAHALMEGQAPGGEQFGSHADYAITMLTTIGDLDGACTVARTLAAAVDTPVANADLDAADEARARADTAALALARCGDATAARAIAARYGVEDFWLSFYLGDDFEALGPPDVGGLSRAMEADIAAGNSARAPTLMRILFAANPTYAASVMHGDEPWNAALLQGWRGSGAFPALRAALLQRNRTPSDALSRDDREYVFTAALMLAGEP